MDRKGCGRKRLWPNLSYNPCCHQERQWDSQSPGRDLNPELPKYGAGVGNHQIATSVVSLLMSDAVYASKSNGVVILLSYQNLPGLVAGCVLSIT
jgi:hypothetical protein